MPNGKIVTKDSSGDVNYYGLTVAEREEADQFLRVVVIPGATQIREKVEQNKNSSLLDKRFEIGKYIDDVVRSSTLRESEYPYLWNEIDSFTELKETKTKDRSDERSFYKYCRLIYLLGADLYPKLQWGEWTEIFDRNFTEKDREILKVIANYLSDKPRDEFRFFMITFDRYSRKYDFSVLEKEEFEERVQLLLMISDAWFTRFKKQDKKLQKKMKKRKEDFINGAFKATHLKAKEKWQAEIDLYADNYLDSLRPQEKVPSEKA